MIGIFILLAFILVGVSMSFNMPKKVEETPPTPNVKTQYRITSNGYWDFLEYFDGYRWNNVPWPYYDPIWGEPSWTDKNKVSEHTYGNLTDFVKRWPNVEDYMVQYYGPRKERLVSKAKEEQDRYNARKNKTTYL